MYTYKFFYNNKPDQATLIFIAWRKYRKDQYLDTLYLVFILSQQGANTPHCGIQRGWRWG